MIVIGIDPGSYRHGVAIVDMFYTDKGATKFQTTTTGRKATVMETEDVLVLLRTYDYAIAAIEAPAGYIHQKQRTKHLLMTARHAGAFSQCAIERGKKAVSIPAEHARSFVCRNAHATDKEVKTALSIFIALPTRSNAHTRDATLVAIVAALQEPRMRPVAKVR